MRSSSRVIPRYLVCPTLFIVALLVVIDLRFLKTVSLFLVKTEKTVFVVFRESLLTVNQFISLLRKASEVSIRYSGLHVLLEMNMFV